MSGRLINLRRARKARAREEARARADANALRHGTPPALRRLAEARDALERARLDGHRRAEAEGGPQEPTDEEEKGRR
ncbi:MAG: DUF4169 family protein [Alphaproteobacteria bacterium]|nr:MAG: DUF4169 family protein [Alphaproteobacteria bacterium]